MSDNKQKAPKARKELKVPTAYPPYVNLLPPEVGQKKAAARARGRAIFVAIIAIGVVVLASAGMNLYALQRYLALENARSLTQSLLTQQGEYNDVRVASQMVQSTQSARIFALSTEISLNSIVLGLNKLLPSASAVVSYSFETSTPLQAYGESTSVLDPLRIGQLAMEVNFPSVSDVDKWVRAAQNVDGVTDATLVTVEMEEDGSYTAAVIIFVNDEALLHRFDGVVAEAEEAEAEPAPEPAPEPTSTPAPTEEPTEESTEEGSGS
ncbi:fimbrial assembly protein [Salinibacterium sp. SWN167]|uniref:fimbrial assembly protein n=1 Tax=Salinibacterium sp. SWN167 TaxID=2792054 RepID=UPI0018CF2226|nr:fimbrial assembly protein [Salinibacterium sp. SWN167]MBH0082528.1 fimbrial assembly protein [Salinibacterium sp. SWN167]